MYLQGVGHFVRLTAVLYLRVCEVAKTTRGCRFQVSTGGEITSTGYIL
ncbi:MAG: hypothetical protein UU32_C0027G0001, partial [Candidatus Woesebacteria bacterium GW2011_GWB1_41_10]